MCRKGNQGMYASCTKKLKLLGVNSNKDMRVLLQASGGCLSVDTEKPVVAK